MNIEIEFCSTNCYVVTVDTGELTELDLSDCEFADLLRPGTLAALEPGRTITPERTFPGLDLSNLIWAKAGDGESGETTVLRITRLPAGNQPPTAGQTSHPADNVTLDKPAATALIGRALRRWQDGQDGQDDCEDLVIPPGWDPANTDDISTVDELIWTAQRRGCINLPAGCGIGFHASAGEHGSDYQWQVLLPPGQPLRLASATTELRYLGEPGCTGGQQALAILREAAREASTMLACWQLPPTELIGSDFTDGASSEPVFCSCGEPVTFYDRTWIHIINPELRGTDDHDAQPDSQPEDPGDPAGRRQEP